MKMGSWKVRILNGNYKMQGDEVVVELYGRTDDGTSILMLNRGFKPYFYLVEPSDRTMSMLRTELDSGEEITELKDKTLWVAGMDRKCVKIVMKHPFKVPQYRERFSERTDWGVGNNILAADIPFVYRFIFDKDIAACVKVTGTERPELKKDYTVDLIIDAESYEDTSPFHPPLTTLSFDIENSIRDKHIFTVCMAIRKGDGDIEYRTLDGDEKDIIIDFQKVLEEVDPDVVTGYNIDNYDVPMMIERAQAHRLDMKWGRDRGKISDLNQRFWRANGRVFADAWWNAKMQLRPKKETLNAIAELVLGERKEDVDPKRIDEEWEKDKDRVISYCKKDAELALRILEKIAVVEQKMDLATVSRLPLNDVINGRTSTLIDSILIREADRNGIGVPMTRRFTKTDKIEGGYVHTIEPGVYNWIITLDFKSMYPSIIILNNICFTTISEDGDIESPYQDVRFLSKERKEGVLPGILARLMNERDTTKKRAKEAKKKGDVDKWKYYYGLQEAIKILMNSFYGVFASAFYRFTDNDIGASITAFARKNVKDIIRILDEEKVEVIYGDTDSTFLKSPYPNLEETKEFGFKLAKRFSKEGAILEFEKIMNPFFTHGAKKRYVGRVVWPTEETLVRGYEIRRTDAFDYQSNSLSKVFDEVLDGDQEEAVKLARGLVEEVSNGKVPVERLVISRTVKDITGRSAYKNPDRMANVQAAKKLVDMGYEFIPGMKVSWIVTDGKRTPQEVEPYIDGREFDKTPDWQYYARRVASSLARVTEVFGWGEKDLLSGLRQVSLFGSFDGSGGKGGGKGGAGRAKKKKKVENKENLNLEDFI